MFGLEFFCGWLLQDVVDALGVGAFNRAAAKDLHSTLERVGRMALDRTSAQLLHTGEPGEGEDHFLTRQAVERLLEQPPIPAEPLNQSVLDGLTQRSMQLASWLSQEDSGHQSVLEASGVAEGDFAETLERALVECLIEETSNPKSPAIPIRWTGSRSRTARSPGDGFEIPVASSNSGDRSRHNRRSHRWSSC
ncbi:MAG: hypothetical protein R2754_12715 [Microthrixaceae bacterium]